MSSLKLSVASNVFGQLYIVAVGILMVPAYVHFLGEEAYGLIGFFVAMQAWFAMLDMGISPTLIRELSRFRAGAVSQQDLGHFIRSAEWLFLSVGVCCFALAVAGSEWVARHWLKLHDITLAEASLCIIMMGAMVGLRWLTGLYRSGLIGMDRMPLVNASAVTLATLRSVIVVAVLAWYSDTIGTFFLYQIVVAIAELSILRSLFLRSLPGDTLSSFWPRFSSLRIGLRFAGAMSVLTAVWSVISQVDRLFLSHYLSLAEYGRFAIVVVAAGGVSLLVTPVLQAVQPRMVYLVTTGDLEGLQALYRVCTQLMMWLLAVVAGGAIFFAEPALLAWTGNSSLARDMAPVLALYAAGYALLALSSLVFQLQYAHGALRRHVVGSFAAAVIWIPCIVLMAAYFGARGTAWAWFVGNLLFFSIWMLGSLKGLLSGRILAWLWEDVLRGAIAVVPVYMVFRIALDNVEERLILVLVMGAGAALAALACFFSSPRLRNLWIAARQGQNIFFGRRN